MRLHLEDVHLPAGTSLFVYSLDAAGQIVDIDGPVANSSDYWTAALRGDSVYVEVDWGNEIPGDVPFRVTALREGNPGDATPAQPTQFETGYFRGRELTYAVNDGLAVFEGDIILGKAGQLKDNGQRDGLGITGSYWRWSGGVIPYSIPAGFPNPSRITDAVNHWNTNLAGVIRFVPRTSERNYVTFIVSGGCSAMVGMQGFGAQPVYLGDGCTTGNVIHELGHAVGLFHEQGREDRDKYVRVLWDNIDPGSKANFNQYIYNGDDLGAYDYNSIMHYGAYSFTINGLPTLETIPAGIPIGQRDALSPGDINAVRVMYGAGVVSSTNVTPMPTPTPAPTPAPAPAPTPVPTQPAPVVVTPQTATVNIQTNPTGLQLLVDGGLYAAPASFTWIVGSSHTVQAYVAAGSAYTFAGWSDGGAQTHTITVNGGLTLKADFSVSYPVSINAGPGGSVTVNPGASGSYPLNTALSISAVPNPGYCFTSWSGLLPGTPANTSLTVNAAVNATANFASGAITVASPFHTSPGGGETFSVPVSSSTGYCGWSATSLMPWVTVVSGARGSGSGNVVLSVAPNNTGSARNALILISGRGVMITQFP